MGFRAGGGAVVSQRVRCSFKESGEGDTQWEGASEKHLKALRESATQFQAEGTSEMMSRGNYIPGMFDEQQAGQCSEVNSGHGKPSGCETYEFGWYRVL